MGFALVWWRVEIHVVKRVERSVGDGAGV